MRGGASDTNPDAGNTRPRLVVARRAPRSREEERMKRCTTDGLMARHTNDDVITRRFWAKVRKGPDCWMWTGCTTADGYGIFAIGGRNVRAHRFSYTIANGQADSSLVSDHLCPNRSCVRASHLRLCGNSENVLRGAGTTARNARKAQCKRGHPFDEENTRHRTDGTRQCRICAKEKCRRWRRKDVV